MTSWSFASPARPAASRGASFADLHDDNAQLAKRAWNRLQMVEQGGLLKYVNGGEYHMYNPDVIATLQAAVNTGSYEIYQDFARLVNERPASALRDLLALVPAGKAVPIEEVESIEAVIARFDSAGMSLGALSPEAHEALATAMNRLGARSNSGEGGEDPVRYRTEKNSKIKQVASGRFRRNAGIPGQRGSAADQGGAGRQAAARAASCRRQGQRHDCAPALRASGRGPDFATAASRHLFHRGSGAADLRPQAGQSHRAGVGEAGGRAWRGGTIAAGVAKAYADLITISGYDGGTGASPLTSIKYAGSPWELGPLGDTPVLRRNDMRHKVRVQTDGGLKTGLDVIKAAILGAESFGFGTAPMVALGCKYLRICHLNNCATGVATQHDVLREKYFIGMPEMVINYFRFVAQECREIMASLGVRSIAELIGHTTMLAPAPGQSPRQQRLDLTPAAVHARPSCRWPAILQAAFQPAIRQGTAGGTDDEGHALSHRKRIRRRVALPGPQFQPLHWRAHFRRDRAPLGQLRHGTRLHWSCA